MRVGIQRIPRGLFYHLAVDNIQLDLSTRQTGAFRIHLSSPLFGTLILPDRGRLRP